MEETRLQRKLREHREKARLDEIREKLSGLLTGNTLDADVAPAWIHETTWGFWDIFIEPLETLSDESAPEAVSAWIEELLVRHGVTGRVCVASHPVGTPWLECRVPRSGWVSQVRETIEDPWEFASGDLDVVVAVLEAEYRYEAHVGRKPVA
ncbi:hypothetical protein [Actinacidiphila acididurans]|uniref:Uncharacterized protein n=1 Tax=Actinacidiphila acididurans TaxID=2784346 RepID=A0ABS2TSR3_9ACTN|nr:hypothetical protein [Actinacidiphila acididurans]MBM9506041.1 hypothetical protein [Actinacidiphila acididurans]